MGGRKAGKKAALDGRLVEPLPGEAVMRVVALRGSNLVEVENGELEKSLCMMPAKFSKCLWIKRGSYVLVDQGDRQKALDAKCKVTGTIAQVLYRDQVRVLQKSPFWPAGFQGEDRKQGDTKSDEEDLPVNTNRCRQYSSFSDEGSESE